MQKRLSITMKDSEVVERIMKGDETALDFIYKQNYRTIVKMIMNHKGSEDEAKDVYQEALIVFWQKALRTDFVLTAKISTYIYAIAKNLWKKELDRKSRLTEPSKDVEYENDTDKKERVKIINDCIASLGNVCRQVLTYYYFDGLSMQDIAQKMGFSNADTAKTKKYKCKQELDKLIKTKYTKKDFLD